MKEEKITVYNKKLGNKLPSSLQLCFGVNTTDSPLVDELDFSAFFYFHCRRNFVPNDRNDNIKFWKKDDNH